MENEGLDTIALKKLGLPDTPKDMLEWHRLVERIHAPFQKRITVAVIGKYVDLQDAYISITESLHHAAVFNEAVLKIRWINAEKIEDPAVELEEQFAGVDAVLVPGGFGVRGIEGKIRAIEFAREKKLPFLGICLGMQCAVIEFARHVAKLNGANSTEFSDAPEHPVIALMNEQREITDLGGTMRLGQYPCELADGSLSKEAYKEEAISERHRHRWEFNNSYKDQLTKAGLKIAGTSPDGRLVEIVELDKAEHPWFVGVQFHPEFKSRPTRPHPLFRDFVAAAIKRK